jgi:hypothetical protein
MISDTDHRQQRAGRAVVAGAVLLLTSMSLQWSFWPASLLKLHQVRQEMKVRLLGELSEDQLTTLHFAASVAQHIAWLDGGREVRACGHMFDVVLVTRSTDGSITIKALRDDREDQVLAKLDQVVRTRQGQDASGKELGSRIISAWAAYCDRFAHVHAPAPPAADRVYADDDHGLQWIDAEVDHDPPRLS